jgi:hypothetical protein
MTSDFVAGVTGALVGAAVGGLISLGLQLQSFRHEASKRSAERRAVRLQNDEAQRQAEIVCAFTLMMKVLSALNTLEQASDQLHSAILRSVRCRMDIAGAIRAFSADFERVKFETDELLLIRSLRRRDLFDELLNLPAVLDLYVDNFSVIRRLRSEMHDMVDEATVLRTGHGTAAFSGSNAAKAKIRAYDLRMLTLHMYARVFHDYPKYRNLACDLQDAIIDRFGRHDFGLIWGVRRALVVPPRTNLA